MGSDQWQNRDDWRGDYPYDPITSFEMYAGLQQNERSQRDVINDKTKKALYKIFLSVLMVVTGTINTLALKWVNDASF